MGADRYWAAFVLCSLLLCPVDMNEMKEWRKGRIQPSQLEQVLCQQSLYLSNYQSLRAQGGTTPPPHTIPKQPLFHVLLDLVELLRKSTKWYNYLFFVCVCTPAAVVIEGGRKLNCQCSLEHVFFLRNLDIAIICINLDLIFHSVWKWSKPKLIRGMASGVHGY